MKNIWLNAERGKFLLTPMSGKKCGPVFSNLKQLGSRISGRDYLGKAEEETSTSVSFQFMRKRCEKINNSQLNSSAMSYTIEIPCSVVRPMNSYATRISVYNSYFNSFFARLSLFKGRSLRKSGYEIGKCHFTTSVWTFCEWTPFTIQFSNVFIVFGLYQKYFILNFLSNETCFHRSHFLGFSYRKGFSTFQ